MQFDNNSQNNYNNHFAAAAMHGNNNPSYTTHPYYYEPTTTMAPDDVLQYELDEYTQSNRFTLPANPKTLYQANRKRPKRKQVKNACVNCQKACKKCDDGRPCQRCIKLGLTETCINSPRKERRKGVKRGPYKKRQHVSTSRYEEGDSQQQQPMSATTASASDWEEQQQAAYAAAAAAVAAPPLPNPIITPPLSQQESPLSSSPLSADVGYYGYAPGVAAAADCASCSSPLSPDFPAMGWNDPHLLGMIAPPPPPPPQHLHLHHQPGAPILVQDLPAMHYEEQYPVMMPAESAESFYYNKPYQQQHAYYPSEEPVCPSCVPPPSAPQMTAPWLHPHHHHQQQQYPYPQSQPQLNNGYWQSFLSAV